MNDDQDASQPKPTDPPPQNPPPRPPGLPPDTEAEE